MTKNSEILISPVLIVRTGTHCSRPLCCCNLHRIIIIWYPFERA